MPRRVICQRFQLIRGTLDEAQYRRECDLVRSTFSKSTDAHWREFLDGWQA